MEVSSLQIPKYVALSMEMTGEHSSFKGRGHGTPVSPENGEGHEVAEND